MMTWLGPVVIGVVALWLAATVAYQLPPLQATLGHLDVLRLLPSWSFFAPYPTMRDTHLVVRDVLADSTIGGWRPVSAFPVRRSIDAIWNPAKRPQKIVSDACQSIRSTLRRSRSIRVVQCSLPYLIVLHYGVAQSPPSANAVARQFAIVDTSGRDRRRIWITFISEWHRL